jgi:hypothetical protein
LVKATPVVIGGLLAVLGGFIGQVITHRLAVSRERRLLLRERIESLVKALYGHSQWLSERYNTMVFRNEDHDKPSPLSEAQMLQELYFPELSSEVLALMQAQIPMMKFIGEQRIERMKDQAAWIKSWNPGPYNEMYKAHLKALNAATKKCREVLQTHLES